MAKKNLVLIPGLVSDESVFAAQIEDLSSVVNIIIPNYSGIDTIDGMINKILLDAPGKFYLAGHSMGGFLALEMMRHHADRVEALCIMTTTADSDSTEERKKREALIEEAKDGMLDKIISQLVDNFTYQASAKAQTLKIFQRNKKDFINQRTASLSRESCLNLLQKIQVPTLVIAARQDHIFFNNTCEIAEKIPEAELVILEECGHMISMEKPKEVTALLRKWLN